jgi:outer membrane lipoprotein-sorting protein
MSFRSVASGSPQSASLASFWRSFGCVLWIVSTPLVSTVHAEEPDAREIVNRVENLIWGRTLRADLEMTVSTPRWQRALSLQAWIERPRRSFIRILAPAKEQGIGSLRIGAEMWNYLPNIERTIKIPPAMMMQPWMGSDFTNDDLVKESSVVDDYSHRLAPEASTGEMYVVESTPKPDAAVVWGRIVFQIRKADFIPLKEEFFDERGTLVRTLTFSEIRLLGGRTIPTKWEMRPLARPHNVTTVVLRSAVFDQAIDPEVFTQRNLQKR